MSAESELRGAVIAALTADSVLSAGLNGVFDQAPALATPPYAAIADSVATDWSVKGQVGREVRVAIALHDPGADGARLGALSSVIEAVIAAMPTALPTWELVSVQFLRSRTARDGPDGWMTQIDYRVRMLQTKG